MRDPVRLVSAVLVALCMLVCGWQSASAGTTGELAGKVTTENGAAVAGAKVTATSPSGNQSTTTDAQGRFAMISMTPDTYLVTASKDGFEPTSQPGVTVIADNTVTLTIALRPAIRTLGTVTVRSAGSLVKPGTTADVYSVNAVTQAKASALGGGGGLDSAYSAIAAVPGAVVPRGQSGWCQAIHIRGGDVDQVGYEFDGVPVLRSYDNYPTTNAATLGQQELQVYTGATPANSESQGLSGFINQVIKSGTYPGFSSLDLGVGSPVLYNKASFEVGGATPDRNFAYFIGIGLADADQRVVDNSNGAALSSLWGAPYGQMPCPGDATNLNFASCYPTGVGPGGWFLGPFNVALQNNLAASRISDRENIFNFHIGIPHHRDSGKDDIQVLYDASELFTTYYGSAIGWGIPFVQMVNPASSPPVTWPTESGGTAPCAGWPFVQGIVYKGAVDTQLATNYQALTVNYAFPNQPLTTLVDPSHRDGGSNGQGIYKLQYQRNFSPSSYLRIYGYTYYSDWYNNGPNGAWQSFIAPASADYELSNHTHGVSATFANQFNSQHLLTLQAAVIGATNYRMNNFTMFNNFGTFPFAYVVDSTPPKNGVCYDLTTAPAATPISCYNAKADAGGAGSFDLLQWASLNDAQNGVIPSLAGDTCGSGPCQWFVAENGFTGGANNQKPLFTSASITDQWRPSDRLTFNFGLRYDRFAFKGSDTSGGARDFWFSAWNKEACAPPIPGVSPTFKTDPTAACPVGQIPATLFNQPGATIASTVWQPRLGGTYSLTPDTVLRFSAGKYAEAPSSAYTQYNILDQDLPGFLGPTFYKYGFTGTSHPVGPEVSYNYDVSLEHHFRNSDVSFKLTPFYRKTNGQLANFFLDQKTNFVSGLNAGSQVATGVEFELNKGDFSRDGLSAIFSMAFTHSYETFSKLSSGGTVLDTINLAISGDAQTPGYNQYTKFCSTNFADARCGNLAAPAPFDVACYDGASPGTPDPTCATPNAIANPYWNAPAQPLFDPNAQYEPYSTLPGGFQSSANGYVWPTTATLLLSYKHDRFAITPSLQYFT